MDLSMELGLVVISPVAANALSSVACVFKGDLVDVDIETLHANLFEVVPDQIRDMVADMNVLVSILVPRMEYYSLTQHCHSDAHKDLLDRFFLQLAAFDLVQEIMLRLVDADLQAPTSQLRAPCMG
ncbi:hypothetical protein AMAG_08859 [Allomyces macrogynus ATCC 38327]|uniref:Uncharacterized protein n=1 Tax=Allomyces macrogynus (strain ATCC 38327) TaxID=578462 RepID=A0A0L0SN33_ALLM3|nr:hypothetical protein AMAG_08859 [Allomyces macrogynus ATCC 38327]|eukprot:KNE63779.1 hypothetical protein AMAG_08859 [Allomyces macrogynus ATCC 38327]